MPNDPLYHEACERFEELVERAKQTSLTEPTAATLATVDAIGRPSARVVLLRGFDSRGFVFYTNARSRKGQQLAANPNAALCFYWDALGDQVRVEGTVEVATDHESDEYWSARHRDSQLGGWASLQSELLDDRATLDDRVKEMEARFADKEVPRPPHWHGYRLIPIRIEFWQNRPARLHDRLVYEQTDSGWTTFKLFP